MEVCVMEAMVEVCVMEAMVKGCVCNGSYGEGVCV